MNIFARPWTEVTSQEIAARYAYQTERLAALCGEAEPCGCGCSEWDDDWLDLVLREEAGEIGAAG